MKNLSKKQKDALEKDVVKLFNDCSLSGDPTTKKGMKSLMDSIERIEVDLTTKEGKKSFKDKVELTERIIKTLGLKLKPLAKNYDPSL